MPGPIDDVLKQLTELAPRDWVVRGGWSAAPATLVDADIATISGAADKAIRVAGPPDWLLAVDFQAGHDAPATLADLLLYNSALFRRHGLLVRSLLVLLHRRADSPKLTGLYERGFPGEPFDAALRYRVIRVWQVPARDWLAGSIGLVPLAPMGEVDQAELLAVVAQMQQRFDREAPDRADVLWSAAYLLMGLRYPEPMIETLLRGVMNLEDSVTYQSILRRGRAEGQAEGKTAEARRILLLLGRTRLGEPSAEVQAALDALSDLGQLEDLSVCLLGATSWEELLGLNGLSRR